jgi:nitric oxide reductase NorD protein
LIDRSIEGFPTAIIDELNTVLPLIPSALHEHLLQLTEEVAALSCPAAAEFLKSYAFVTERAGLTGLEYWFREGLELLQKSEQGGIEYFRIGTGKSTRLLEKLSPGMELTVTKKVLETYCLALAGKQTPILPIEEFVAGQSASAEFLTHGGAVFLPDFVNKYPAKSQNFAWYKVMATHQIGHIEFGSYEPIIDDRSVDLCHSLGLSLELDEEDDTESDLARFLKLFDNRRLAADIFTIVEDSRVDFLIKQQYRGIRQDYSRIQTDALSIRPPITSHSLREMLLEILVRLSLESTGKWLVPSILHAPLHLAGNIMSGVLSSGASIKDSAGAAILLYHLASRVPGDRSRIDSWKVIEIDGRCDEPSIPSLNDVNEVLKRLSWNAVDTSAHFSPAKVEYRGIFRLEPAREITEPELISEDSTETDRRPDSQQIMQRGPIETGKAEEEPEVGALAADTDLLEETPVFGMDRANEPDPAPPGDQTEQESDDNTIEGALEANGTLSYLYDEWDFRASDYRLRWCRVREIPLAEGNLEFYEATLDEYAQLLAEIRGRFEQLNPRSPRKVKRLHDGEDIDFDALIDFVIGRRAGQSSEAKIYWRRNKTERDVSVAFLLDMSSSTVEYINRLRGDPINPVFARDYFEWLYSDHKGQVLRPKEYKRIIDLEKESTVLLIRALEAIGDNYGIYGFSGHGRENVEFYVVKDLEEDFSDRVKSRIDSIIPQQGTRMGPAIRHATWKLERQDSKGKFLFLISDGRPEDHSYGREGLETDYAINDTKMALLEARRKGITSLCLTFDQAGHDYLRAICSDINYEVLADIESLPACLPDLYEQFTT